jgi:site-specific recombinase XerD
MPPVAIAELVDVYVSRRLTRREIGKSSASNYRSAAKSFVAVVGNKRVWSLCSRDVERWRESQGHLAVGTIRLHVTVLRHFLRWLYIEGYTRDDLSVGITRPRQPRRLPRALRPDQLQRLLDVLPDARARVIVILCLQLGLRAGEVVRLTAADIDWGARAVFVTGKGDNERLLPLTDEAEAVLDEYLIEYPPRRGNAPLVRSYRRPDCGLTRQRITMLVAEWMKAAGLKHHPYDGVSTHALRHTAATDCLRHGAHLRDVQQFLGHRALSTTEVYLPLEVQGLRCAIEGRRYLHPSSRPSVTTGTEDVDA